MNNGMRFLSVLFFLTFLLGIRSAHAENFLYDLGIGNQDITFSKGSLVAGDTIRIYGRVTNWGTKDISGYVTFYQGDQLVGD